MLKFAANLSMQFNELPFLERFKAAADAGFRGVEFLFPYDYDAETLVQRLEGNGLKQVLFNMPPGNWDAGERGLACLPDRKDEFRAGLSTAVHYAKSLACRQIHCMAGIIPNGLDVETARATYAGNVRLAAQILAQDGLHLLIEPINTRDMPGYFLNRTQQALDVVAETGLPNVRLQYDCYHMHIMEGDLNATIARNLDAIAHIQIADAPGRHEPGTGDIDYAAVFRHLDQIGYSGWIGCEYRPKAGTLEGLSWMTRA